MIWLIAALQTIDSSLYEAVSIDGANRWAAFRYVTFPGIKNISIVLWILMTIWSVNDFETPFLLTQGGPSNATENLIILDIRHLPIQLFLTETRGEAFEERVIRPTFTDPYTLELLHFHEVVTHNVQPKTTAEDFLHDLDLFDMIINALRE